MIDVWMKLSSNLYIVFLGNEIPMSRLLEYALSKDLSHVWVFYLSDWLTDPLCYDCAES